MFSRSLTLVVLEKKKTKQKHMYGDHIIGSKKYFYKNA